MVDIALPGSALAARCTACSTVFRVVPDQLRVSEGWVRCGRCSQVFNAAENLIDLDTGAPRRLELGASLTDGRPAPAPALPGASGDSAATHSATPPSTFTQASAPASEPVPETESAWPDSAMAATQPLYGPPDPRPTAVDTGSSLPDPMAPDQPEASLATATDPAEPSGDSATPLATNSVEPVDPSSSAAPAFPPTDAEPAAALPSFVRRADRAARWRQPRVRAALAGASALATLVLVMQVAFSHRDTAAAHWPALRPALEAGCQLLGCRVGPAQAIEALTVESSGLLRVEQTRLYQLTVGLRNRATIDLAVPALELSLTDAQGRLLSRRVLSPSELGLTQAAVGAGRDLALQATLQTAPLSTGAGDDELVVGYTIELFYP